jgi:hypothetical protein
MDYVASHPQAMDSVEGIVAWWIPGIVEPVDLEVMQRVLDRLTERGALEKIGAGNRAHYRLRKT